MSSWSSFIAARGAAVKAWYRLGESSAVGGAVDASGNGRTLTYRASSITYGVAGSAAGDADTAVTLAAVGAGSTSYIAHGTSGSYVNGLSALTLVAAVKMPSGSTTGFLLTSMDAATTANGRFFIDLNTGKARCNFYTTGAVQHSITGVTAVNDNAWHLIIAVLNGTTGVIDLYIGNTDGSVIHDGTRTDGSTPFAIQTPGTDRGVSVGGRSNGTSFDAENTYSADEAVILNEAWSATDVANAVRAWANVPLNVAIGRAVETDTARALTATEVPTLGRASTTSTARALTATHTATLGRAATVATAFALTATQFVPIGRATETDTAQTVTAVSANARSIARASETDTAQALTATQTVAVGRASETDTARALGATQLVPIGRATETDTARTLTPLLSPAVGRASETDAARALTPVGAGTFVVIGRAIEIDTAQPLTAATDRNVGQTQLSWLDGRRRDGIGVAFWEPPVDSPPRAVRDEVALIKAYAYDSVTVDGALAQPVHRMVSNNRARYRIKVSHKDVTYFRGVQVPEPTHGLIEPLLYGSGSITWPQIHASFEKPGEGELWWLRPHAPVHIQRVHANGDIIATDYRGIIADFGSSGRQLTTAIDGEATGRAQMYRPQPIFPGIEDIGHLGIKAVRHALRLPTMDNPPETGIKIPDSGDKSHLDFITDLTARSTTLGGDRWTIMPNSAGVYRMFRKDTTTVDFTVYCDDSRVRADLRRDLSEESDRVFVTALDRNTGMRIRFIQDPGMDSGDHPPGFPRHMSEGDTGTGVFELTWRLWTVGLLDGGDGPDTPSTFTADVEQAVEQLQDKADLPITGEVDLATWRAAFENDKTGWSLRRTRIKPAAEKDWVEAFKTNASGQILGRNSRYRRKAVLNDRVVDMGNVDGRWQARHFAQHRLWQDNQTNLVGTIDITMGAVIAGAHHVGDPLDVSDLMDARAIRPGMNVLVHFQGDEVPMHVASRDLNADRTVQIAVDTQARDALEVWEIHNRNREARRDPARQWKRENRSSTMGRDAMTGWDEIGGKLDTRVFLNGHTWRVFPVVAGEEGQVREVIFTTDNDPAEFVLAMFGKRVTAAMMARLVGDPFTDDGKRNWRRHGDKLRDGHLWMYEAGWSDNPCGYHPTTKVEASKDFPEKGSKQVTGRWVDTAGFPYRCDDDNVLWVAMYASWDTFVQPGRVMKVQLNDQI